MIGADAEARLVSDVANTYGRPVLTATEAIYQALSKLNAKRVRLLAPYPQALLDKAQHYWAARGVEITEAVSILPEIEDTRNIYTLTSDRPASAFRLEDVEEPVLISGTGLPSSPCWPGLTTTRLSSNLCLAWSVLNTMGQLPPAAKPMDCIHTIKPDFPKFIYEIIEGCKMNEAQTIKAQVQPITECKNLINGEAFGSDRSCRFIIRRPVSKSPHYMRPMRRLLTALFLRLKSFQSGVGAI